eukprot:1395208-Amorphochlora_amoeboformis.AAC.2
MVSNPLRGVSFGAPASKAKVDKRAFPLAEAKLTNKILDIISQVQHENFLTPSRRLHRSQHAGRATKALNRGSADLIILAGNRISKIQYLVVLDPVLTRQPADTTPLAILLHLPLLCEDKNVPYVFIPSKAGLGRACGIL